MIKKTANGSNIPLAVFILYWLSRIIKTRWLNSYAPMSRNKSLIAESLTRKLLDKYCSPDLSSPFAPYIS